MGGGQTGDDDLCKTNDAISHPVARSSLLYDRAGGDVAAVLGALERDLGPPYHFPEALKKLGPGEVNRPLPWHDLTDEFGVRWSMPDDSPPKLIMSVLPRLQAQNERILALLEEQNELLRQLNAGQERGPDA